MFDSIKINAIKNSINSVLDDLSEEKAIPRDSVFVIIKPKDKENFSILAYQKTPNGNVPIREINIQELV